MDEEDRTLVGIVGAGHLGIARTRSLGLAMTTSCPARRTVRAMTFPADVVPSKG